MNNYVWLVLTTYDSILIKNIANMNKIQFNEFEEHPEAQELINSFISFLKLKQSLRQLTRSQRLKHNKLGRNSTKKWLKEWSGHIKFIIEDENFMRFIGLDESKVKNQKDTLKSLILEHDNTRASPNKDIKILTRGIVIRLKEINVRTVDIIDLIYRILCEYKFDDYGQEYWKGEYPNDTFIDEKTQKDRIRNEFVEQVLTELKL